LTSQSWPLLFYVKYEFTNADFYGFLVSLKCNTFAHN
jgi:hypothetical protein